MLPQCCGNGFGYIVKVIRIFQKNALHEDSGSIQISVYFGFDANVFVFYLI